MARVDWNERWRLCKQEKDRLSSVLRKRGERGVGHGMREQLLKPGRHPIHGQGHHVQANFQLIAVSRSHDSDDGCGVQRIGEQGLRSKFRHRGVEPASGSHNIQKSGKVCQANMRRATVDRAHVGFDGFELIQGVSRKPRQIDPNRGGRQSMRRSQSAGRYEKSERIRGIKLELARSERVRPGTEKWDVCVRVAKCDSVLLNRDVYRQIETFYRFMECRLTFFQPDRPLVGIAGFTLSNDSRCLESNSDKRMRMAKSDPEHGKGLQGGQMAGKMPGMADGAICADGLIALKGRMIASGQEEKVILPRVEHVNHRHVFQGPLIKPVDGFG